MSNELPTTKACTLCQEELPIEEFSLVKRRARRTPGSWCRPCIRARKAAAYYANRDREREKRRAHYAENRAAIRARQADYLAGHRDENAARSRRWYAENRAAELPKRAAERVLARDQIRARDRAYYLANRQRVAAINRAWTIANRERMRSYQAARRARRLEQEVEHVDRRVVFQRDEGVCGICGKAVDPADWHLDHVVPLARGGEHSYANTQVSHPHCNQSKGARMPADRKAVT